MFIRKEGVKKIKENLKGAENGPKIWKKIDRTQEKIEKGGQKEFLKKLS